MQPLIKHVHAKCLHVWARNVIKRLHKPKMICVRCRLPTHSFPCTWVHRQTAGNEQSVFLFAWFLSHASYPRQPSLETSKACVCVCAWLPTCLSFSLPHPPHPASALRYHVNKAGFSPSKGDALQLPDGGDRAERRRETRWMEKKGRRAVIRRSGTREGRMPWGQG